MAGRKQTSTADKQYPTEENVKQNEIAVPEIIHPESEVISGTASLHSLTTIPPPTLTSTGTNYTTPANIPLDQNPAAIYLASLRPVGRRGMRRALAAIVETVRGEAGDPLDFPWHTLRFQHTQALRAKLSERYRPATVNHMLSALRGVLSQAENLGLISADDFRRTTKLKGVRGETLQTGRSLGEDEIRKLLTICRTDATLKGMRDVAVVAVLYGAGLRRSELVKLDLKDFELEENSLKIRSGKGGKDRLTYLGQGPGRLLGEWVKVRGETAGPLFLPVNKGGKMMNRRLSDQAVLWILEQRGKEAGLAHFSPHDMRRTFISDLLDAGADIATVQKLAGHANVTTTARYDRRGEATKQKAAELLNRAFTKPGPDFAGEAMPEAEVEATKPGATTSTFPDMEPASSFTGATEQIKEPPLKKTTKIKKEKKPALPPRPAQTLRVALYLRIENNSKFVRGKSKARSWIEQSVLQPYGMEKPYKDRSDYFLTIPHHTNEELDKIIGYILQEADAIADSYHCFIEADVQALDGSERSW